MGTRLCVATLPAEWVALAAIGVGPQYSGGIRYWILWWYWILDTHLWVATLPAEWVALAAIGVGPQYSGGIGLYTLKQTGCTFNKQLLLPLGFILV